MSNISFVFWAMEFQEKMLLRFTDLYTELDFGFLSFALLKLFLPIRNVRDKFDNFEPDVNEWKNNLRCLPCPLKYVSGPF